jgi:hypothetical protein
LLNEPKNKYEQLLKNDIEYSKILNLFKQQTCGTINKNNNDDDNNNCNNNKIIIEQTIVDKNLNLKNNKINLTNIANIIENKKLYLKKQIAQNDKNNDMNNNNNNNKVTSKDDEETVLNYFFRKNNFFSSDNNKNMKELNISENKLHIEYLVFFY